jgi:hypothetical protein
VRPVARRELEAGRAGPGSGEVAARVREARRLQEQRTGPAAIAEALGYRDDWSGGGTSLPAS